MISRCSSTIVSLENQHVSCPRIPSTVLKTFNLSEALYIQLAINILVNTSVTYFMITFGGKAHEIVDQMTEFVSSPAASQNATIT
ncbi:3874_t:CDS:2 [Dentiscutata erythropus]|uniref:3874_t:CDS:1 n=1 Tax=Dentiscutata erythropus TaxID=1348616 RepID=A0A9N8ZUW5_9GLOM|nr:3874_t:CDS:2 [Dentiscutata erythropus]